MEAGSTLLLKVKKEEVSDSECQLSNSTTSDDEDKLFKAEYHCKEEINIEWNEEDNGYAECELECNKISHGTDVKSESDNDNRQPSAAKPRSSSKKPNALPKLIKRCCPKCDNLTEITTSYLYRKKKCTACSTVSVLFQCAKCCKRYAHYDSIRYHVNSKCYPDECLECPAAGCLYKTTIRSQLTKHVKRMHEENDSASDSKHMLKCNTCGKEFKYTYSLNRHSKKSCGLHFPKTFVKCDDCDRKFKNCAYLRKHMKVCINEK